MFAHEKHPGLVLVSVPRFLHLQILTEQFDIIIHALACSNETNTQYNMLSFCFPGISVSASFSRVAVKRPRGDSTKHYTDTSRDRASHLGGHGSKHGSSQPSTKSLKALTKHGPKTAKIVSDKTNITFNIVYFSLDKSHSSDTPRSTFSVLTW